MAARLKVQMQMPSGLCYVADSRGQIITMTRAQVAAHNDAIDRAAKLSAAAEVIEEHAKELEAKRKKQAHSLWLAESARKAREAEKERTDIQARLAAKDAKERAENRAFARTLRKLQKQFAHVRPVAAAPVRQMPAPVQQQAVATAAPVAPAPRAMPIYDTAKEVEKYHRTPHFILAGVPIPEAPKTNQKGALRLRF